MKTISPALKAHIQQEVTTIATCMSIARRDGRIFYLTDHDEPITYDEQVYLPYDSYARTSILTSSELEVDNLELTAFLNSSAVTRDDVASGLFDGAEVRLILLNYADVSMGSMLLRRGWLGEVTMNEDNTFRAEVRGLTQVLTFRVGDAYAPECRTDLGSNLCKLPLNPKKWNPNTGYDRGTFVLGKIGVASGYTNLNLDNGSFETDTVGALVTAPSGWVAYGDATSRWVAKTNWYGLDGAAIGNQFIAATRQVGTEPTIAGLYQDVDLVDQGVSEANLDTGLCRLVFKCSASVLNNRAKSRVRLSAIQADGTMQVIFDTGERQYGEDRWITINPADLLIPTGARKLRIDLWSSKRSTHEEGCAYDGVSAAVNAPDGTYEGADQYGGVVFKCIQSGVSGDTEPAFSNLLGDTFTDGGVIWQCVSGYKTVDTVATVLSNKSFSASTLADPAGWFDGGVLYWETGRNAGRAMEVKTWAGGVLTLFQRTYYPVVAGDRFVIHPGCDKRRGTCFEKFANIENFRGEPDVPGQDNLYKTPNAPEQ